MRLSDFDNHPPANIEGVDVWAEQELLRDDFTVTLRANDIGVVNDGGLLTVSVMLNMPYPLIDVQIGSCLNAAEARTLVAMLTYGIGLLEHEEPAHDPR